MEAEAYCSEDSTRGGEQLINHAKPNTFYCDVFLVQVSLLEPHVLGQVEMMFDLAGYTMKPKQSYRDAWSIKRLFGFAKRRQADCKKRRQTPRAPKLIWLLFREYKHVYIHADMINSSLSGWRRPQAFWKDWTCTGTFWVWASLCQVCAIAPTGLHRSMLFNPYNVKSCENKVVHRENSGKLHTQIN